MVVAANLRAGKRNRECLQRRQLSRLRQVKGLSLTIPSQCVSQYFPLGSNHFPSFSILIDNSIDHRGVCALAIGSWWEPKDFASPNISRLLGFPFLGNPLCDASGIHHQYGNYVLIYEGNLKCVM